MAFDYAKSRATASKLIARFGRSVTLRQFSNTGTDLNPTRTPTDTPITVVDLNQVSRDIAGTLIEGARRTLYAKIDPSVAPAKDDQVVIDGTEFEVAEVRPLSPGGLVILYEIDLAG